MALYGGEMMVWIVGMMAGCVDSAVEPEAPGVPTGLLLGQLPEPIPARFGVAPKLSSEPPVRTESACGFQIDIKHLFGLSNARLAALGAGRITPLIVAEDGSPLRNFATSSSFQDRCDGASNVGRNVLRFSPAVPLEEAGEHTYTLLLSDALPLETPTGPAWWVYPGTALRFGFPDSELSGRTLTLEASGWASQGRVQSPPLLAVGDQSVAMREDGDQWAGSLTFTVPEGEWEAEIQSEEDGTYLALSAARLLGESTARDLLAVPAAP